MLRLGLALLAAFHLLFGVPAVVAPHWYFDHFPGAGHQWTAAYPPYNEHLMTDVGAAFTALGVLLAMAAVMADRRVTNVVLIGLLVFSALHLAYHTGRHGNMHGGELLASLASLAAGVLGPLALLWLNRRRT
ncbi:hypothetical protein Rhe02_79710 [Rhizocola hellebori]|uniref:Uncharacterized protein n=1 Tax=Rhizocola hellebori TaxID=1392758 RepID=A0A8J3QHS4_9ACTN|nr:hypothetical protein [Rhizocola hellebori]GIH09904.1 hypothetical protein Rhe02_79710 [Rhizocola hellebori]